MMQPNPRYGMVVIPTTWYPSICNALSHLFMCSGNGAAILLQIALENRVVGWACGFVRTKFFDQGLGRLGIVPKQQNMDMASPSCNWKHASSNAKTSHVRLVSTFTGHTIKRFGQSSIHFFSLPFTQWLMSFALNQTSIGTWLLDETLSSTLCKLAMVFHVYSSPLWLCMDPLCWPAMPNTLCQWIRQSRNSPLVFPTLGLQHIDGVIHHILIMCEGLLNACPNESCVRVGDW